MDLFGLRITDHPGAEDPRDLGQGGFELRDAHVTTVARLTQSVKDDAYSAS